MSGEKHPITEAAVRSNNRGVRASPAKVQNTTPEQHFLHPSFSGDLHTVILQYRASHTAGERRDASSACGQCALPVVGMASVWKGVKTGEKQKWEHSGRPIPGLS